jgi:hypothetical protein
MPLTKYYDEAGAAPNRIDQQGYLSKALVSTEIADITSQAMDFDTTLQESKWVVSEVALLFSGATARDFQVIKKSVANIVRGMNDRLWISVDGQVTTKVVVDPGVYTSTTLAAELKSKLESSFSGLGVTFTVSYTSGQFTITNSGGLDMSFYSINTRASARRNSTIGENIGFTQDQGPAASLVSDTVIDLDAVYPIIAQTGNTDLSYILTDELVMDSDSALNVSTNTAAVTVTAKVTYERR